PFVALAAQIRQSSFLMAEAFADLLEQFPPRGQLTGPWARGSDLRQLFRAAAGSAAAVAALAVLFARLKRELVARHAYQQLQQLLGLVQVVLAGGSPHEEAGQDRLANVHRVEQTVQTRVVQPQPNLPPDHRLIV